MLAPLWLCALAGAVEWTPPQVELQPRPGVYRWLIRSDDPDLRRRLHEHLAEAGAKAEPDELPYTVFSVPAGRGRALAAELKRYGPGTSAFQEGRRCPKKERERVGELRERLEAELPGLSEHGRLLSSARRLGEAWLEMYRAYEDECSAATRDLIKVGLSERAPPPQADLDSMARPVGPPLVPPEGRPGAPYPSWDAPSLSCGWPGAVVELRVKPRKGERAAYNYEIEEGFRRRKLIPAPVECARSLGVETPGNARLAATMAGPEGLARLRAYAAELGWTKETLHRIKRDRVQPTPSSRWRAALKAELAEEALRGYPAVRSLVRQEAAGLAEYDVPVAPQRESMGLLVLLP